MTKPLLLDCRQGWAVDRFRVPGWRPNTVHNPVEFTELATKEAAEKHPAGQLVILDYEQWKLPEEIAKHIQVIDWWREVRPELRIGYYGILPKMGYWPAFHGGQKEADWEQENAALGRVREADDKFAPRGLVDVVDFVCPCLYSFYAKHDGGHWWDHEATWLEQYAPKMIAASRAYQKQVYPFVWMRIHREDGDLSQTIPPEHFRQQVKFCIDNADGVCIWDWDQEKNAEKVMQQTSEIMKEFV